MYRLKKLFIFIALLSFIKCEKDPTAHHEKFFDPQKLPQLSLEKVNHFWQDDSIKNISNFIDATFNEHSKFLDCVRYSGKKNVIGVSIFQSQTDAIDAMELRRNNVAAMITVGGKNELISGKWWLTQSPSNSIFLNQWNIIIEVAYYYPSYEEIPGILIGTAAEIAKRIDSLSD
ncbi:hypothetical protein JW964_16480 [candidate division KSB1 bacterium]|nr:hypothetical protein [candidate division KSB1 bacterium]